jgi:inorganic pyrophosphatase
MPEPDRRSPLFKSHPWHGVSIGAAAPALVTCYIEIVPTDVVKYEIDKATGHLKLDRPQKFSNICPSLYGFVPQTLCGERVAAICEQRTARRGLFGDGDPMDICVLTEKPISHGDILVEAVPIGGLRMIDNLQVDDKIISVLRNDSVYGGWNDIAQCSLTWIERLKHYFLTYKDVPGAGHRACEIAEVYGRDEAHEAIRASREDYRRRYAELEAQVAQEPGP